MELTGIGPENAEAFAHLMEGWSCSEHALCVGAIEEEKAAGVAIYNALGDSLILDYIYVAEEFRRRGIGTALIEDTLAQLNDLGIVALHVNYPESAADLHGLILSTGFKIFRHGTAYRTKVEDFLESETTKKMLSGPPRNRVVRVSELTRHERSVLKKALDKNELDPDVIDEPAYTGELSLATLDASTGNPEGLILCTRDRTTIVISYLVNFSSNPILLLDILKALREKIVAEDYTDNELLFLTLSDSMVRLPEKLLSSKDCLINDGPVISGIRMLSEDRKIFAKLMDSYHLEDYQTGQTIEG